MASVVGGRCVLCDGCSVISDQKRRASEVSQEYEIGERSGRSRSRTLSLETSEQIILLK